MITMLLLAIPLVQPESGVAAMFRLWRDARLPTLHGSKGVSLEGDWKTAGLDNPVLPLLIGVVTLHLCLTTFANLQTANIVGYEFSSSLFWLAKNYSDSAGDCSWSIFIHLCQ